MLTGVRLHRGEKNMAETNEEILGEINGAIKAAFGITQLGDSILPPEKFAQFVQVLQEPAVALKDARRIELTKGRADIDRIGFLGRISKSGGVLSAQTKAGTQTQTALTSSDYTAPTIHTNQLNAREFVAIVALRDQILKRNIEQGSIVNTLIQLIGDAAGKDMEENAILGDLDYTGAQSGLELMDGWLVSAGNAVYGTYGDKGAGLSTTVKSANAVVAGALSLVTTADLTSTPVGGNFFRVGVPGSATLEFVTVGSVVSGTDTITFTTPFVHAHAALEPVVEIDALPGFNYYAANYPENMFDAMIEATPKKYIGDPTRWAFYVQWETLNAYQNLLKSRNTQLGDQAQVANPKLYYKGFAVKADPIMDRTEAYNNSTKAKGKVCLLSSMDNMAWGVENDIRIEPQRDAKSRLTEFVLSYSMDVGYEDEDAATACFIDIPAPAA